MATPFLMRAKSAHARGPIGASNGFLQAAAAGCCEKVPGFVRNRKAAP